jgi:hypothetical protein
MLLKAPVLSFTISCYRCCGANSNCGACPTARMVVLMNVSRIVVPNRMQIRCNPFHLCYFVCVLIVEISCSDDHGETNPVKLVGKYSQLVF